MRSSFAVFGCSVSRSSVGPTLAMLICLSFLYAGCAKDSDGADSGAGPGLRDSGFGGEGGVGGQDIPPPMDAATSGTGGTGGESDAGFDAGSDAGIDAGPMCTAQAEACADVSECCSGLSCSTTLLGQICCGEKGTACATADGGDCCGGLSCIDGECGYQPLSDATCQPNCRPLSWLADVLRDAGLLVTEDPNWTNHGHGQFTDVWGIMAHHTGDNSPNAWQVVRDGRPDLQGPLSQLVLEQDGRYRVLAIGVAWHAGTGSYPGLPDNNANFYTIGIEAVNNGTEGWTRAQYDAYVQGSAAILKYLGHDASRVIGHKEWAGAAQGKWDPGLIEMDDFRDDVQAVIDDQ